MSGDNAAPQATSVAGIPSNATAASVAAVGVQVPATATYTSFAVYAVTGRLTGSGDATSDELRSMVRQVADIGVQIRGFYDVSGFRADADVMVWWHGQSPQAVQAASRMLRRTAAGRCLARSWAAMGVHRSAEFNRDHMPAFLAGAPPKAWATVYPFIRSYDWYLLPPQERRDMLVEHGMLGGDYPQVLTNTVAAFALGDYEWLLALEADHLHDTVDLMRDLRAARARLHVREETPFYTGRRITEQEVAAMLTP